MFQKLHAKRKALSALVLCGTICMGIPCAGAYESLELNEAAAMARQADAIIAQVDNEALMEAALNDEVDYSVPSSIRETVKTTATFIPKANADRSSSQPIELETISAIQKIGEISCRDGSTAPMYATVAAFVGAEDENLVQDSAKESLSGVAARAILYWYDYVGTNNQLRTASGQWAANGKVISNRTVTYGLSNIYGSWMVGTEPITRRTNLDRIDYIAENIWGLAFRCTTTCEVVNIGTLSVTVLN